MERPQFKPLIRKAVTWGHENVPPGLRTLLGLVLMIGGVFGFLPILGFWMIPVGALMIALDIPPLRRRLLDWTHRHGNTDDRH